MYSGKTLFAQLTDFLPWTTFPRIVERYGCNHRACTLPCTAVFLSLDASRTPACAECTRHLATGGKTSSADKWRQCGAVSI